MDKNYITIFNSIDKRLLYNKGYCLLLMVCQKLSQLIDFPVYHGGHRNWENCCHKQHFEGDVNGGGHLANSDHLFSSNFVSTNPTTCGIQNAKPEEERDCRDDPTAWKVQCHLC